jgi:acyl-CoA reductase-like NAD-dependent aldehyde dehydrogenase
MNLCIVNPASGTVLSEVETDSPERVSGKLARAREAQRAWHGLPVEERVRHVRAALGSFRREREEIAREVSLQMGKPIREARGEVDTMLARAEHMLSIAPACLAPERLPEKPGFERRIEHEPLGVVLDIAAWNYPLLVPINVVVPALLAGNAVVLKHSPKTPLTGLRFEQVFAQLPVPGILSAVTVPDARAGALVDDPRVDHVCFTGSVATGRSVYRAAAARLIGAGLELGGKDPAYVAEDADLEFAAANVVEGACYNAGQSCCAVERAYVHRSVYARFLELAQAALGALRMGDPLDEGTTLGPLVDARALSVVEAQVGEARSKGARVLCGGRRWSGSRGFHYEPTLLADCPEDSAAMREETFGPLLPVRAVESDEEAVARMNDSRYGLTASVWTRDAARADRLARDLVAGTVYQNRCDYLDPELPWTGVKESGIGSTLSRYGFFGLTRRKSVHLRR